MIDSCGGLLGITDIFATALPNSCQALPNIWVSTPSKEHLGHKLATEMKRLSLDTKAIAERFGVERPSVYDWLKHGRMAKKHYPMLVEVFGRPLEWWFGMPYAKAPSSPAHIVAEPRKNELTSEQQQVLLIYDSLPRREREEFMRQMREKKENYDVALQEMLERRSGTDDGRR